MEVIKVAIADDHKIFRKGVILSLRPFTNIKFVLEAENGDELLSGVAAAEPDVVLMDLRMPGKDGIETTKALTKQFPNIHIIVFLPQRIPGRLCFYFQTVPSNGP